MRKPPKPPKLSAARQRDLEAAISSITKAYGDGSIMRLGDARALRQIEVIPTGALAMDLALGVGGIPRGPRGRNLRPGILGQDHVDAARDRQRPEERRAGRVH